jgi:peptidoglycan/LPS O-acetylase OafA/YrhL
VPETLTRRDIHPPATRRERRNRFRGDIEGLRAVAVLLVVTFHAGFPLVHGGFVGVDVFFVLSGFLITGLLLDEVARTGTISLTDFYARRIRRLLPLSTLVLAATAVATYAFIPPIDRRGVAGDLVGAALWGANWKFAADSTQYMADTDKSPVLHFWSLAVEEQFYVLWPLLLLVLVGGSGLALRAWPVAFRRISLALGLVTALSLWASSHQTVSESPFAYFGLHTRAWELGVGAGLALVKPALRILTAPAARGAGVLGLALVVGSALLMDETTPFPGTAALLPVLGTALVVAGGARLPDGTIARGLAHPVLRYIGRVSYAWYLWHWPVLVLAKARWGTAGDAGAEGATHLAWPAVLAALVLSFVLSVASHHLVEQPLRQASFLKATRRRSLRAGAGMVAVSLGTAAVLAMAPAPTSGNEVVAAPVGTPAAPVGAQVEQPQAQKASQPLGPRTPEQARADEPRGGSGCYVGYQGTAVPSPDECRIGPEKGGTRTIAVIGDSHANAWRPALERTATERGWTVYFFAKTACSVIDVPVAAPSGTGRYAACDTWRRTVLQRVASIEGLDAVVIGRYMGYRSRTVLPDGSRSTASTVAQTWSAGARRTVDELRRATDRIVIMRDVPWPEADVPSCLSEHSREVEACAFDRSSRVGMDEVLVTAEKAAAPKAVAFVDMSDIICPEKQARCQVVSPAGQIMYRDQHHLTAGYSASLWKVLSQRIDAAIR